MDPRAGAIPFSSLAANGVTVSPQGSPDASRASESIGKRDTVARTAMFSSDRSSGGSGEMDEPIRLRRTLACEL